MVGLLVTDTPRCDDVPMATHVSTPPSRGAFWTGAAVITLVACAELGLASRYGKSPPLFYLSDVGFAVVYVMCGLVAWRRRPDSRIGPLMVLLGGLFAANAPWGFELPDDFPLITLITPIGVLGYWLQMAVTAQLFLTYPSGRCQSRPNRQLVTVVYLTSISAALAVLLVLDPATCAHRCGVSPVHIVRGAAAHDVVIDAERWWRCLVAVGLLAVLIQRLGAASPRHRRRLALPLGTAIGALILTILTFLNDALHPAGIQSRGIYSPGTSRSSPFRWRFWRDCSATASPTPPSGT